MGACSLACCRNCICALCVVSRARKRALLRASHVHVKRSSTPTQPVQLVLVLVLVLVQVLALALVQETLRLHGRVAASRFVATAVATVVARSVAPLPALTVAMVVALCRCLLIRGRCTV